MKAKALRKWAWGIVRLGVGLGIVLFLLLNINRSSQSLEFTVPATSVSEGALYTPNTNSPKAFIVLTDLQAGTTLTALGSLAPGEELPDVGRLYRVEGDGPDQLKWTAVQATPCGLRMLGGSFAQAGRNWPLLLLGLLIFLGCLGITVVRWRMLLKAQGLDLTWGRAWSIMFIGHFFNAFMFGATGGDVVKAYYVARETGHKKTEAATTVFVDRAVGLLGLVILAVTVMLLRLDIYLAFPQARYAFVFIGSLGVAAVLGLLFTVFFQRLVDRFALVRRLMQTFLGKIFHRIYTAFYVCITHPPLFASTIALSVLNQFLIVVMMCVLARAMGIGSPIFDIAALAPTINTIGAVPVTPGGLGLREYAAVTYMGLINVPATQSLPLSLSVYAAMLFWSLVGGIVFLFSSANSGGVQAIKDAAAEDG